MTTNPNGFSLVVTCSHDLLSSSGQPRQVHQHDIRLVNLTNLGWESEQMVAPGRRLVNTMNPEWRKPAFMVKREALARFGEHLERLERSAFQRIEPEKFETCLTSQADLGLVYLLSAMYAAERNIFIIENNRAVCRVGEDEDLILVQFLRQKSTTQPNVAPQSATQALRRGGMRIRTNEMPVRR